MSVTLPTAQRRRIRLPSRPRFLHKTGGIVGTVGVTIILLIAFIGPAVAQYNPDVTVGAPFAGPSSSFPLGTDVIGRDVLSRVLHGGYTVILLSLAATAIAYAIGLTGGLIAGYRRSWRDSLIMRGADVLIAFPPIIFLLVVATGAGQNLFALVLAIGIIQSPGLARIIRSAVLEVSSRSYVEAAVVRGDRHGTIMRRDILPNIAHVIAADVGLRLTYTVILFASVSFLGLGVPAPQADWARMISENRIGISYQPWAVLVPALVLAIFLVSVNLISDAVARSLGISFEALEAEGTAR